jgi:6-phosphofructokinase 1
MADAIDKARQIGRHHQIVIVAEGARHADGLHIHSDEVKTILSKRLGIDVRLTVLGHVQRGGAPTAFDRILATRLGAAAVDRLLRPSATGHHHMLGLSRNTVQATPLEEVLEKSQAVREEIENSNYSKALELRGESFRQALGLVKTLTRITPAQKHCEEGGVAVLTAGADAPGMNAAVSVAARCLLNQGFPVYGAVNGFAGLIQDQFRELDWHELEAWVYRPSSEIGTARVHVDLDPEKIAQIAQNFKKRNLKGLIAIGGWDTYFKIHQLLQARKDFQALQIPIIVVPASIDNNLPCTAFSVGADTALNNIVDAVDKIGHTAGATSRTFIVEVMGRQCGFLALMGALASGAEKAYLPETGINLAELNRDVEIFKNSFAFGKKMIICLRNEHCSRRYTTDFIHRVFEEESNGAFEVRTAILGHLQRGGTPTAFDRILASRMGATAAFSILDAMKNSKDDVLTLGLRGRGITAIAFKEAFDEMDIKHQRPKNQWFMELVEVAGALAKHAPGDPMAEKA